MLLEIKEYKYMRQEASTNICVRYDGQRKGMLSPIENSLTRQKTIKVEFLDRAGEQLDCKSSQGGSDDAFFPAQLQLLHHLTRHTGMKLNRDSDIAI